MTYKVLVVDDSSFFQIRLKEIINEHPELSVVGFAANGQEAIDKTLELHPDIISMDYEMPYMDGVSAVRGIMAKRPTPIIMFSSMTYEGARITLDALDAGALDFIPKNFAEVSRNSAVLKKKLHDTLLTFARKSGAQSTASSANVAPSHRSVRGPEESFNSAESRPTPVNVAAPKAHQPLQQRLSPPKPSTTGRSEYPSATNSPSLQRTQTTRIQSIKNKIQLIVIGSSTGGPVALTEIIKKIPSQFRVPILVVQHMPENFTKALAERLDKQCSVRVVEAQNGDHIDPGTVYVAPGGHQMILNGRNRLTILPGDERVNYKPSVDVTFASAAKHYNGAVLGIVLTGMGADGCEGARLLKQQGAVIWGQDRESCVVYGMPKAIADAGLTDDVIPLANIGDRIVQDI